MPSPLVFVVGATGTVGSEVSRHLISLGWGVHATTRDHNSTAAKALQAEGVKFFQGSWDDKDAINAGLSGCSFLFMNISPQLDEAGEELVRAQSILSSAKAAGVRSVVYSSVAGAGSPEKMRFSTPDLFVAKVILSKQKIEAAVRDAGFAAWTILRPAFFAANFLLPNVAIYFGHGDANTWTTAFQPDSHIPVVDEHDIAVFATEAFKDPARFNGQEIDLAGELLYPDEIATALSKATARDIRVVYMTDEDIAAQMKFNPIVEGQWSMRDMDQYINIDELKAWGLPLGTFEGFLERRKEDVKKSWPPSA